MLEQLPMLKEGRQGTLDKPEVSPKRSLEGAEAKGPGQLVFAMDVGNLAT